MTAGLIAQVDQAAKFTDAALSGLALGAIYALLALGLVLIFKATQVLNFAHGALAVFGAYFAAYFAVTLNFPGRIIGGPVTLQWALSALAAVVVTAAFGFLVERVTIRPMVGEPLFAIVMITIGLDIVVRTITNDYIGNEPRPLGSPWGTEVLEVGPGIIAKTEVATIVVTVLALLGVAWFFRTRLGVAITATAFDQEAAMAQGIDVGRVFALAWGIGAGLAALGGIFSSLFPRSAGASNITAFFAFRALPAIVIGGLDSIVGSVIAGFALGITEIFIGVYLTGDTWSFLGVGFAGVWVYLVMMVFLLVRPYGLFGTEEVQRV